MVRRIKHISISFSPHKKSACNAGGLGSIPGSQRSPGEGNGYPLQYSCLENSWTEEPGTLQSMGLQRVRHAWATNIFTFFSHSPHPLRYRPSPTMIMHSEKTELLKSIDICFRSNKAVKQVSILPTYERGKFIRLILLFPVKYLEIFFLFLLVNVYHKSRTFFYVQMHLGLSSTLL